MDLQEVNREDLYGQVWKEPMTKVAKKYGVSSSYLARVCETLGVPRPERGYWAKLAAGKCVRIPALPEAKPEHDLIWSRSSVPQPDRNIVTPRPYRSDRTRAVRKKPTEIPSIHPLLRDVRALFLKGRRTRNGYLKPHKWNLVDIITFEKSLDSALKVANAVFLEFYQRSWTVKLEASNYRFSRPEVDDRPDGGSQRYGVNHWSPGRLTLLYVGTVAIGLTLIEDSEKTEMAYVNGDYVPTATLGKRQIASTWTTHSDLPSGRFRLRAYSPYGRTTWQKEWSVKTDQDLGKFARRVAVELKKSTVEIADQYAVAAEKSRREQQEWQDQLERMRIAEDEKLRSESLSKSTVALESLIADWGKAKAIENFFGELEQQVELAPERDREHLRGRLEAARALTKAPDVLEILKGWQTPEERYEAKKSAKSKY